MAVHELSAEAGADQLEQRRDALVVGRHAVGAVLILVAPQVERDRAAAREQRAVVVEARGDLRIEVAEHRAHEVAAARLDDVECLVPPARERVQVDVQGDPGHAAPAPAPRRSAPRPRRAGSDRTSRSRRSPPDAARRPAAARAARRDSARRGQARDRRRDAPPRCRARSPSRCRGRSPARCAASRAGLAPDRVGRHVDHERRAEALEPRELLGRRSASSSSTRLSRQANGFSRTRPTARRGHRHVAQVARRSVRVVVPAADVDQQVLVRQHRVVGRRAARPPSTVRARVTSPRPATRCGCSRARASASRGTRATTASRGCAGAAAARGSRP